jgi:hypothetical protein
MDKERVFSSGAAGIGDDSPLRPFIVIRSGREDLGISSDEVFPVKQHRFQFWVHDEPGTMLRVDVMMDIVKNTVMTATLPGTIQNRKWEGVSPDGYDDHYLTNTRYGEVLLTGR